MLKASIKNGNLILEIPVEKALRPSATGKTLVVASTRGNVQTTVEHEGKPLIVGLNAYVYANPK